MCNFAIDLTFSSPVPLLELETVPLELDFALLEDDFAELLDFALLEELEAISEELLDLESLDLSLELEMTLLEDDDATAELLEELMVISRLSVLM